jgi:anaerobic magnesium-protoporphyrin IX monomethyl ester cyclase
MNVLLLAGEGPYFKNNDYLDGSLFDTDPERAATVAHYFRQCGKPVAPQHLAYRDRVGWRRPLLRKKKGRIPNLTAFTLQSILHRACIEYTDLDLDVVWRDEAGPDTEPDVVLLSTTYICDRHTLRRALAWIRARAPRARIVLGGQYSNLAYRRVLTEYPDVYCVVRGDGEEALPALLNALARKEDPAEVPNLVRPGPNGPLATATRSVDLEAWPSPRFPGDWPTVPYESMRGCPFRCKFCSFPAASPEWRYKSAQKIHDDWTRYAEENGTTHLRALDSTFTVPPARLAELLPMLADSPVTWEAYTRANVIRDASVVNGLALAHCRTLSIGFESMSDNTLSYMHKQVRARQNRTAHELLRHSPVGYRISFMCGYPGETPEDYRLTHDFLVDEYAGHFMLSVLSLVDETMPVWQDAARFQIEVADPDEPDYSWRHVGMDVATARQLQRDTLDQVRHDSDSAVLLLWQSDYETPLVPWHTRARDLRAQKAVERLAMLPVDRPDPSEGASRLHRLLAELAELDIELEPPTPA